MHLEYILKVKLHRSENYNKIKGKYSKKKQEEKEKKENWDMFQKKMDDLKISLPEQELIKREILHKEAQQMRDK